MSKVKIACFTTNESDLFPLIEAVKGIKEDAEVCLRTQDDFWDAGKLKEFIQYASESHLIILHLHGGKGSFPDFDRFMASLKGKGVPIHAQATATEQDIELIKLSTVEKDAYQKISRYINYGGTENFRNLLLYVANQFAGAKHKVQEPKRPPWEGIYHPDFSYIPSLDEYLEKRYKKGRLTVGLWFYQSFWMAKNTLFVDSLIKEIERQNANIIPVFIYSVEDKELGTRGVPWVVENYFMKDGRSIIDVLISPLMFSLGMRLGREAEGSEITGRENEGFLEKLGVPVIKAILTFNTFKEWQDTLQGLNPLDITISIAMPEFDGILITVPVAAREHSEKDPLTGAKIVRYEPIPERISKIVRFSLNWAKLRHIPTEQKKVAIIFHNYPPRNDQIGTAFGLDSPASVLNILRDMEDTGYKLDSLPESGQTLIEEIIDRVTNDRRWTSSEELARRAVDSIPAEKYVEWFQELPLEVQDKMKKAWGEPPGQIFNCKGRLLIPGIINGNVFIGLQPPRGFLDDPAAIYHSPDHPIPHHYYAYYRWIRDVFGANAVMHIGKHGSLEWLPGKSAGLSESCFPDIAISDLPNIYPYIINNPGEGTQAKRRSYCCIIDHLIPVMHNADTYEELAELEVQLNDYYQAKLQDPEKLPHLQKLVWEKVKKAKLDHDLEFIEDDAFSDFDGFLERLHGYLNELSDTQIRDGLHIFGEPPEEERLIEFLAALTRLSNGDIPSLRESISLMKGYDYEGLLKNRGRLNPDGRTNGQLIDELNVLCLKLVKKFQEEGFQEENIDTVMEEVLGKGNPRVRRVLAYMATSLIPKISATIQELKNTLLATDGNYISPGPSGAPTRGMADILPTGRNFYSVDPQAIPSPAAWRVGVAMGDALLSRYREDEGEYPESIGIIIWGTGTMRTKGDNVAEILYLMGVKPVWEETSGRVKGIEIIPMKDLKRPRIDVTLRISGLFRDAFPNLVYLIDEAVEMVASLKESPEKNYLARNVNREVEEMVVQGIDPEEAKQEAMYRIFGCRPGAYGAGVSDAIYAKNWKNEHDLAEIYVKWGGYAYGRRDYGATVPEQFKRRLSQLDLTVKNEDTREYDMLDSDDFYSYHGGMIAAVKAFKGAIPRSYSGDTSDPERVKIRSTKEEAKHIFRARILNPKWIKSMKRHGYKGASDLSGTVDFAFGWDATAEVLEDWMYEELANKYALDDQMQKWLKEVNPFALQNIAERLLEAINRKMWNASDEMKEKLTEIYLEIEGDIEEKSGQ